MEVKPLNSYRTPAYPEKYSVLRNPYMLKALPQRWKGNAKIGIALSSIVMMMLAGCGEKMGGNSGLSGQDGGTNGVAIKQTNETTLSLPVVTPIFKHGTGRGSFGCVSVAPPAFLSEAEAYEVISEEAKRAGIVFERGGFDLENVNMPLTSLMYDHEEKDSVKLKTKKGTLDLDGYDSNKKIAYEFISKDDIVDWNDETGMWSSVESYDALGAAEKLKEGLDKRTEGNTVALFYDPMGFERDISDKYSEEFRKISENEKLTEDEKHSKWMEIHQKHEEEIKELAKSRLREQVKDFLNWLKAQGVI